MTPLFSVMDILESVISIGKRGVEITRFKGLGEMDAKDLFLSLIHILHVGQRSRQRGVYCGFHSSHHAYRERDG